MTTDLASRASYAMARRRHARRRQPAGSPIVVFSMAKTGSSAVAAALRTSGAGPVFHVHDLDPDFLANEELEYRWSGRPWRIWDAQRLLRRPATSVAPWRVVSILRDPIAQTVSAFFQPGVRRGYVHPSATVEDLRDRFGDRFDHLPLRWFETHVRPALDIDVYGSPFDPRRGYQIVSTPTVRLLLLRCEDLAVAPAALADLVGADQPVAVPRVNVGAEKDHAGLYQALRAAVRPTAAQLDRSYGSRMVRHFYAADEIDRFRGLWSDSAPSSPPSAAIRDGAAR